jgi:hypothetical protein
VSHDAADRGLDVGGEQANVQRGLVPTRQDAAQLCGRCGGVEVGVAYDVVGVGAFAVVKGSVEAPVPHLDSDAHVDEFVGVGGGLDVVHLVGGGWGRCHVAGGKIVNETADEPGWACCERVVFLNGVTS